MTDAIKVAEEVEVAEASEAAAVAPRKHNSRIFRSSNKVKLAPESAKRQGDITTLAFLLLGGREPAIALLNQPHADLGARPLDLATASAEGYAAVESIIRRAAESSRAEG